MFAGERFLHPARHNFARLVDPGAASPVASVKSALAIRAQMANGVYAHECGGTMWQRDSIRWFGVGLTLLVIVLGETARAQSPPAGPGLSVEAGDSCLNEPALRERVTHYRDRAADAAELHVRVDLRDGVAGFVILQGERVLARRRFQQLPAACGDQRDTLALAIAVALASVTAVGAVPLKPVAAGSAAVVAAETRDTRRTGRASLEPMAAGASSVVTPEPRDTRRTGEASLKPTAAGANAVVAPEPRDTRRTREVSLRPMAADSEPVADARHFANELAHDALGAPQLSQPGTPERPFDGPIQPRPSSAGSLTPTAAGSDAVAIEAHSAERSPSEGSAEPDGVVAGASAVRADDRRAPQAPASLLSREQPPERAWACCDLGFAAGARYGLQLLPDPVLLFGVGIELGLAHVLSLQAAGFASPVTESAADGGRMRAQLSGGELLLCARPVFAQLALRTCAGAGAASVAARGEGFSVDHRTRLTWLGALARVGLRWPAEARVAAELVLGGHANLVRPRMRVVGSSAPDRVSWLLGGSVGVQLVVSL